jgi:hypothetical protein
MIRDRARAWLTIGRLEDATLLVGALVGLAARLA